MSSAKKKPDAPSPAQDGATADTARLIVRVKPGGPDKRYRAGLGPFGAEPVTVEASAEQRAALEADAWLVVEAV